MGSPRRTWTINEIVQLYRVGEATVRKWIRNGDLRAFDVSPNGSGRKQLRISQEALDAFEALRSPAPSAPRGRRRRKKNDPAVIEFYK